TSLGRPCPPSSTGCWTPCQPPAQNWRNASAKPAGVVTTPSASVDGERSPSRLSTAMTSSFSRAHSSSTAVAVSMPASSKPGKAAMAGSPATCSSVNNMSRVGALNPMAYSAIATAAPPCRTARPPGGSCPGGHPHVRRASRSECRRQFGHGSEQVGDEAVVGHAEDGRFLVLVDRDDQLAVLHAGEVLDSAGNSDGDVEFGRHDLAGLADLPVVRRITG